MWLKDVHLLSVFEQWTTWFQLLSKKKKVHILQSNETWIPPPWAAKTCLELFLLCFQWQICAGRSGPAYLGRFCRMTLSSRGQESMWRSALRQAAPGLTFCTETKNCPVLVSGWVRVLSPSVFTGLQQPLSAFPVTRMQIYSQSCLWFISQKLLSICQEFHQIVTSTDLRTSSCFCWK